MMAVLHPTKEEFTTMIEEKGVILVDFFATWCGPCKMIGPVIEQVEGKYAGKIKVVKIDIDQEPELTAQYEVNTVPTIFVLKDGQTVAKEIGFVPLPKIVAMLDAQL